MLAIFNRPFPPFVSGKKSLRTSLLLGLVVFAILFFIKPFGFDMMPVTKQVFFAVMYGLASFMVGFLFLVLLPAIFPQMFNGMHWTVGKEILFFCSLVACVSVANVGVNMWLQSIPFSFSMFTIMVWNTLLVAVVPITIGILVKQQVLLHKYQAEARTIEAGLSEKPTKQFEDKPAIIEIPSTIISGDNQGEILELVPEDWLAAEANDNYTRIYFLKGSEAASVLFRCTLKKLEESLAGHPSCFRCHKSFLVNLARIEHIRGNAQGYRLHLPGLENTIPVSRSLNATIREKLTNR
jgi:hypothetical protein